MNKYNIDLKVDGIEEKSRYTAIEKARRVIALQDRIDKVKTNMVNEILEQVNNMCNDALKSNSTEIAKFAERLNNRIITVLEKIK